jgi:hypothetical protein
MPYITLSSGLTLTIPTNGTINWGTTVKNSTWTKISQHDHTGSGNGTPIGTTALVDRAVTSVKLAKNFGRFHYLTPLAPSGTTQTVNWNDGQIQNLDLGSASGNVTLTFSNPVDGATYQIFIEQGATARTITWPGSVIWPGGSAPTLQTGNGDIDRIDFVYDGTNYWGQIITSDTPPTAIYSAIVGDAADVTSGLADYSSITAAIAGVSADATLFLLPRTYAENVTVNKRLTIVGTGYGCYVDGTMSVSSASCNIQNFRIDGDLTVSANSCYITGVSFNSGFQFVISGTASGNYLLGVVV